MIRFFRTIRQSLLAQGRITRYLTYAVGEIVLVMVGILLALQVNNWNEGRKRARLEEATLKELRTNLLVDIKDFKEDMRIYGIVSRSAAILIEFIDGAIPYHDSLNVHFGNVPAQGVFTPNKAAYENLKATGINLITNDTLRAALSDLYEGRYHYMQGYMDTEYQFDHQTFGDYYLEEMKEYDFFHHAVPVDPSRLVGDQHLRNLITHRKQKLEGWFKRQFEISIRQAEKVIGMIDKELAP